MRIVRICCVTMLVFLLGACSASPPREMTIPHAAAPRIDDVISAGEWEQAAMSAFSDGSELLLMHDDTYLYAAIREKDGELVAGNLYFQQGDVVRILHASAALGSAEYALHDGKWTLTKDYTWCCRERGTSEKSLAARANLLAEGGWSAANSFVGEPHILEYQIEMKEGEMRMAANFLYADTAGEKTGWPADIADDVLLPTPSRLPDVMSFQTDNWVALQFE